MKILGALDTFFENCSVRKQVQGGWANGIDSFSVVHAFVVVLKQQILPGNAKIDDEAAATKAEGQDQTRNIQKSHCLGGRCMSEDESCIIFVG